MARYDVFLKVKVDNKHGGNPKRLERTFKDIKAPNRAIAKQRAQDRFANIIARRRKGKVVRFKWLQQTATEL